MKDKRTMPHHVAIIMDGNGRWARQRHMPHAAGHRAGAERVDDITEAAAEWGIGALTLYAFSTENWKRPKIEKDAIFRILAEYLDAKEAKMQRNAIRFSVLGRASDLPRDVRDKITRVVERTRGNTGMRLNLAVNYGSRTEIVDAARAICTDVLAGKLSVDAIDEEAFADRLYTKGIPDPDLLVRTSGEMRVSNFLLWQISYAEIYVTDTLWPDFTREEFRKALDAFAARERRYGG